jgi:hypothetical protein
LHSFSVESERKVDAESGAGPLVRVGRPRMLASQKNDIVCVEGELCGGLCGQRLVGWACIR